MFEQNSSEGGASVPYTLSVIFTRFRGWREGSAMKVLLAIDDSKFSEAATQAIIQQMRPDVMEVRVLHVVQLSLPMPSVKEGKELVARAQQVLRNAGLKVETAVEEGDPRVVVIDYATRWNADLIVVGSHRRTGLARFLLGSVAEFVVRHSRCSVEVVRILAPTQRVKEAYSRKSSDAMRNPG